MTTLPRRTILSYLLSSMALLSTPIVAQAQVPNKSWVETATKPSPVNGQPRLALIIGNTNYSGDSKLKNPENDARDVARALAELGFTATVLLDGSLEQMSRAIHQFADSVRKAGTSSVALLYYSGHGIQVNGSNYLIPVDFKMPQYEVDIVRRAISAQSALEEMQSANAQINIAILDACRTNPFNKNRAFSGGGLAKQEAQGTLIAYATAAGKTADDAVASKNGLYTTSLLQYLRQPGLTLYEIFKRTTKAVYFASNKKQFPYIYDGLIDADDFRLLRLAESATTTVPFTPPPLTVAEYKAQMVSVPAGEFTMGRDKNRWDEGPTHVVSVSAYRIGKTPVTVGMWEEFCRATGRAMPPAPVFNSGWTKKDHPIVNVSWNEAQGYCAWAKLKLPTEAQWEKAARGTDGRLYPWGNEFDSKKLWCSAVKIGDAGGTCPVGSYPAGASPYGCLDMEGNVYQMCEDAYDEAFYLKNASRGLDPVNPSGDIRAVRGCCWTGVGPDWYGCSVRCFGAKVIIANGTGFRCALPGP